MIKQLTRIQLSIVCAWAASFCLCIGAVIWFWIDIPSQRELFVKNAVETFAPGLGTMFAAAFVRKKKKKKKGQLDESWSKTTALDILALIITLLYLLAFDVPVARFIAAATSC